MALVLIDGLEDLSSWTASADQTTTGRHGTGWGPSFTQNIKFTIPTASEHAEVHVGFAFKTPDVSAGTLVALMSDAAATTHTTLIFNTGGSISVARDTTVLGTSATGVITANVYYYIEFAALLSDSVGTYAVSVNGTSVLTGSSADTKNGGTKTVYDTVKFVDSGFNAIVVDDVYIMAGAGDSFLGEITVETLYPNGNGNANQFVGSDGDSTNNYLLVDEAAGLSGTADYTTSGTTTEQDMYTLTDLVHTTGTIIGICHASYVAKSDVGTKQYKIVNRRSSDNKTGTLTPDVTPLNYTSGHYVLTLDPETSAAWTIANVNALQSGVEIV